jgi:hypothetical protein
LRHRAAEAPPHVDSLTLSHQKEAAMSAHQPHHPAPTPRGRLSVALARLTWFAFGPVALALLAYSIVAAGTGWTTWLDAAFAAVALLMLAARWYELRSGEGQDGFGNPATTADFPKYAGWAISLALAAWLAANVLGNHVLNQGA